MSELIKENHKQLRAFCIYATEHLTLQEMGEREDLPSYHTLKLWSRRFNWHKRRKEFYAAEGSLGRLRQELFITEASINNFYRLAALETDQKLT